jgi:hypothetical protein
MVDTLKDIFDNVNNWLKFAEVKNATLIAGNGVMIFGVMKILNDLNLNQYAIYYIYFSMILLFISLVISLISFMSKLKIPDFLLHSESTKSDNLLFFGDIVKYREQTYLKKIHELLASETTSELDFMYVQQIIVNSKIAINKFKLFNVALNFTIAGIVSPIGYLILHVLFIEKDVKVIN